MEIEFKHEEQRAKKLVFRAIENDKIVTLIGLVTSEDSHFIHFQTRNREYRISKEFVISLQDTNELFEGV